MNKLDSIFEKFTHQIFPPSLMDSLNERRLAVERHNSYIDKCIKSIDDDNDISLEDRVEKPYKGKDKLIYINLWHGNQKNLFNRGIMKVTKSPYSHASLSIDKLGTPFFEMNETGLVWSSYYVDKVYKEYKRYGIFENKTPRIIDFYGLYVDDKQLKKLEKILIFDKNHEKEISYNLNGLFKIAYKILLKKKDVKSHVGAIDMDEVNNKNNFICSAYVLSLLIRIDDDIKKHIQKYNNEWELYSPEQLRNLPNVFKLYQLNFEKDYISNKEYADRGLSDKNIKVI